MSEVAPALAENGLVGSPFPNSPLRAAVSRFGSVRSGRTSVPRNPRPAVHFGGPQQDFGRTHRCRFRPPSCPDECLWIQGDQVGLVLVDAGHVESCRFHRRGSWTIRWLHRWLLKLSSGPSDAGRAITRRWKAFSPRSKLNASRIESRKIAPKPVPCSSITSKPSTIPSACTRRSATFHRWSSKNS